MNAASFELPPMAPPIVAPPPPHSSANGGRMFLRICVGLFLLFVLAPAILIYAAFHIDGDTKALTASVISPDPGNWQKQIELDLGTAPFLLARMVAPMIKDLPEEARTALSAVRDAEFSVYQLKGDFPDNIKTLAAADERMTARGFDRVVAFSEADTLVAVYSFAKTKSVRDVNVSVLVIADRQLVTVSAKANLEEVLHLALREAEKHMPSRQ